MADKKFEIEEQVKLDEPLGRPAYRLWECIFHDKFHIKNFI